MQIKGQAAAAVLLIGTCHEYQRHQDRMAARENVRADFEKLIRETIAERSINLIAEEAGNNKEVHDRLKADEIKTALDCLFAGTETVDQPQDTIAKFIASELPGVNYVDIRPPGPIPYPTAMRGS